MKKKAITAQFPIYKNRIQWKLLNVQLTNFGVRWRYLMQQKIARFLPIEG